jgi:hypothetical protein
MWDVRFRIADLGFRNEELRNWGIEGIDGLGCGMGDVSVGSNIRDFSKYTYRISHIAHRFFLPALRVLRGYGIS